jgi:hypothetical protein
MKKLTAVTVALALGFLSAPVLAEKGTKESMRNKLDYAQNVLEGITLQEFDFAVTNAVLLRDMNQTNVFALLKNVDYLASSTNFALAVDNLINAAKSQDLERATEAYTRVARSCVQCHEQFQTESKCHAASLLKIQTIATTKNPRVSR